MMLLTNTQMGLSCFESSSSSCIVKHKCSCGGLDSRRPLYTLGLRPKRFEKFHVLCLRKPNSPTKSVVKEEANVGAGRGQTLEKELTFQPSFGDYLKAMETVRSVRQKRQANKLDGSKSNEQQNGRYAEREQMSGKDEEDVKVKMFEGFPIEKEVRRDLNRDDVRKSGNKLTDTRESENKLDVMENGLDTKLKRSLEGGTKSRLLSSYRKRNLEVDIDISYMSENAKIQKVQGSCNFRDKGKNKRGILDTNFMSEHNENKSVTLEKEKFVRREDVDRGRNNMGRLSLNQLQVDDNNDKHKRGNSVRSRQQFLKRGDKDGLEMDRAAFKMSEEFDNFSDRPSVSRKDMEERIQKLAKLLNGADINMPEWMFSKTIRSAKIIFTDHTILRIIQILGKLGNWKRVLQVIDWLQMRERYKSYKLRHVYTTALDVLGKSRRPVEALNIFHAMQQQTSLYPDVVAYHSIAVTLGQAGHIKELFDVIDIMRSPPKKFKIAAVGKWNPQLEPDVIVYNAVLNACVQQKQWEGAFWVLQQLKQQHQQPSATTYGLVMEVMLACGKYNLVHEFFRKVQRSSIPNALTYKVLVNTLWREGKVDKAILAVQDMERRGVLGSASLYYDLARCLCSNQRCKEALMQIEKICRVASKPLVVTYTGLIQACLDAGHIDDAKYIFNQMKEFCSPNLITCNIMVKAYLDNKMFEEASELFRKMLHDEICSENKADVRERVMPDNYTFNTMLDACVKEKRWGEFENVYKMMLDYGHHFNTKRHLSLLMDAYRAGKVELLEMTWTHLVEADRIPPPCLIKERFCLKLERDDYVSAILCITNQPVTEADAFSVKAWSRLLTQNAHRLGTSTLVEFILEVSSFSARRNLENLALQNMITACRSYVSTKATLAEIKQSACL